ncbi:MAG: AAA family ATPase [Lachnospiraceae bacterium]|nr:AAA family ATPase [Lachnospiraceae bacterium]
MGDSFMDAMGSLGGGSDYTLDEIRQAEKLKKKNGGTLVENLEKVTGRGMNADPFGNADALKKQVMAMQEMTDALGKRSQAASDSLDSAGRQLAENSQMLDRELRELNENLARDFGIAASAGSTAQAGQQLAAGQQTGTDTSGTKEQVLSGEAALDAFDGIAEKIGERVYGQEAFLKKLVIAFKRPYVMPAGEEQAKNTVFVSGANDTGRHFALKELAGELAERKLIGNDRIRTVDLGIYTDASMESVFLQDIYAALSDDAEIILFENFENCHPSFLTRISALVTDGGFRLPGRYVSQKGQLVSVQNALATDAVSMLHAAGKYLVFVSEKSLDKAAGIMGAAFVDALKGDVCVTGELDEEAIRRIAACEQEALRTRAGEQCFFDISFDDDFAAFGASRAGRQAGVTGVRAFYASVLEALAQARLEGSYEKGAALKLRAENGRIFAQHGEEQFDLTALLPESYRGEIEEIREELDAIVGLHEVKNYVLGLEEFYRVQKRREEEGLKTAAVSKHMIFTGNPGTGKTTIARIISRYLKAIGVLTGGQLVEVSRADLVGRYVGHTAPLTNQVIQSAIGGVLFIDEAYSLYRGKDDSFGLEAIDTLVKGIEDNRDNLIVILAGYSKEMQEFLTANSGLKSRFPNVIDFPNYTGEELLAIARSIAKSKGYEIDTGADETLCNYFNEVQATRAADAGNGRLARNLVEEAILNQSRRLVAEPDAELSLLVSRDFDL